MTRMPEPSRRSSKTRWRRSTIAIATAAVVAVIATGAALAGTFQSDAPTTYQSTYTPAGPPPPPEHTPATIPVPDAMARLSDPARPFTIGVIGDSTGVSESGWVFQVAEHLGRATDRTVIFHHWFHPEKEDTGRYYPPRTLWTGKAGTIEVWNGSASGEGFRYSSQNLSELLPVSPEQPDIIFMNHGHNAAKYELEQPARSLLLKMSESYPNAAIVSILQNPQDPTVPGYEKHERNIDLFRDYLDTVQYPYVDVHAAYLQQPSWETMFHNNHPTPQGYTLWADLVLGYIGFPR